MNTAHTQPWTDHLDTIDMVAELTRPWISSEDYDLDPYRPGLPKIGLRHQTRVPSLLVQLEHAMPSGQGDDRSTGGYESRPAARLEAVDALLAIEHEVEHWLKRLEPTAPSYPNTLADQVAKIGSKLHTTTWCKRGRGTTAGGCCDRHHLEGDIRRWWVQARIVAGWDTQAWKPDATCPQCATRGSLRIRLSTKAGLCVECRETWDPTTVGVLGEHVRAEAFTRTRLLLREPCWCPWPTPIPSTGPWPPMCGRCASVRCHRAIAAGELQALAELTR